MSYWTWFLSAFLLAFQFRENGFCHKCLCIYTFECYCSPVISFTILWTINKHRKLHLADVTGSFSIEKLTSNVQHFFFSNHSMKRKSKWRTFSDLFVFSVKKVYFLSISVLICGFTNHITFWMFSLPVMILRISKFLRISLNGK